MSEETVATATGRRKTAVARVQLRAGSGKITVNDRPFEDYLPTVGLQNLLVEPFNISNLTNRYDVSINAQGGGINGQVDAMRLAISRALLQVDAELRPALKEEGLLRRDSRAKERKKAGQPGARKRFQFSKR